MGAIGNALGEAETLPYGWSQGLALGGMPMRMNYLSRYTPKVDEEVYKAGAFIGIFGTGVIEIGLYDVTDGITGSNSYMGSIPIDFGAPDTYRWGVNTVAGSDIMHIIAGRTYASALRVDSDFYGYYTLVTSGVQEQTVVSSEAFPSTYTASAGFVQEMAYFLGSRIPVGARVELEQYTQVGG